MCSAMTRPFRRRVSCVRRGHYARRLAKDFAFRSLAEEKATRAIAQLVALAPTTDVMEFYATQLLDEARHAMVFRSHLIELGVADEYTLPEVVESLAGDDRDSILNPLEEFGLALAADPPDFIGGVVVVTVLVEGVLAPSAELSERKWRPLTPPPPTSNAGPASMKSAISAWVVGSPRTT